MSSRILRYIVAAAAAITASAVSSRAQFNSDNGVFKDDAFNQTYNEPGDTTARDSSDTMFSFKEYYGGLAHKRDARIGVLMAGSTFTVGGMQIYNRDYWKLPVVYGGIGAGIGFGISNLNKWKTTGDSKYKNISNWCFAGAGLVYWGSLLDGVLNYDMGGRHEAGKATALAVLFPGLGQAYNGEFWKIPIYYGCLIGSFHYYSVNHKNYKRFQRIYNSSIDPEGSYDGPVSSQTAKYYRDIYRRYRDYSVVAIVGFYLLQIIDANVFSYMKDFELSDDLALGVSPTLICDEPLVAQNPYSAPFRNSGLHYSGGVQSTGIGLKIGLTF